MVTSNKLPDKKVVRMDDQNNSAVVPQRTLLGEVNEHITCPICRGYYIDATTIVECLHSFCRSCIIKHLQVKSYCPVCEMMINSAKPNIKLDKALQDIVYKLVPGLFQREMERRQQFYASRPGTAAAATPEQRGEDTERIIFSPDDVISFSLEYVDADVTDTDSVSSKSSDASTEVQATSATSRRYLQCPAVVNISHLKKFLSMKFNIDCSQFAVDILYKKSIPLPDYYTLMDIAYIYNWKRIKPMRFYYQIIDYVAMRNRLFEVNRKGSHFEDEKMAGDDSASASSPAPNLPDPGSEEASSGTDSPMLKDNYMKHSSNSNDKSDANQASRSSDSSNIKIKNDNPKADEEVEKSQFLNSFELTAKNNSTSKPSSPVKAAVPEKSNMSSESSSKTVVEASKDLKRKQSPQQSVTEVKKLKIEIEKPNISNIFNSTTTGLPTNNLKLANEVKTKPEAPESPLKSLPSQSLVTGNILSRDSTKNNISLKPQHTESSFGTKRSIPSHIPNTSSPKKKPDSNASSASLPQKTISPLKVQLPKPDSPHQKPSDTLVKPYTKKMPDLKPSVTTQSMVHNKQPVPKIRMDLLANNSDPTIDRSKILSQVKSSLGTPPVLSTTGSGDPLRSLFDSCKINIPSSLSITLTDQKQEARNPNETAAPDSKKNVVNKNLAAANTSTHKVPSPPVHNYIEILKIPESEAKKQGKGESSTDQKALVMKPEMTASQIKPNKPSETSAKGPVPNLKPISDTKHGKSSANYASSPITFQQTFEQQLQSLQSDKKPKLPKTKGQVPKLVPATPKTFTAAVNKLNHSKPNPGGTSSTDMKPNIALDLSTAPNIQQSKAFETMQSIANLAKKQGLPPKAQLGAQNNYPPIPPRSINTTPESVRMPPTMPQTINQIKLDKMSPNTMQSSNGRQDTSKQPMQLKPAVSPSILSSPILGFQPIPSSNTSSPSQPSPRSQTRSPSCSPKLVIAEEKQPSTPSEQNMNQSNQISSTQQSVPPAKNDSPKVTPGPSKPAVKSLKPVPQANKISGIRQPITPTMNPVLNPTMDYLSQPQLIAHHALLRHQMEMQSVWLKARHDLLKNMSNIAHQNQNDFNKDKQ